MRRRRIKRKGKRSEDVAVNIINQSINQSIDQSINHKNQLIHCVTTGLQKKRNAKKLLKQRKL